MLVRVPNPVGAGTEMYGGTMKYVKILNWTIMYANECAFWMKHRYPVTIIKETAKECIANFPWPTKWSEEDERILKGIIGKIDHDQTYGVSKAEMLSFLKSLRPQPKQEWSEEDENNLNKLLQWDGIPLGLRSWVSGLPEKVGTRPSWKPSEGQKEALKRAIDLLEGEYCDHPEELDSLLNDLNKL